MLSGKAYKGANHNYQKAITDIFLSNHIIVFKACSAKKSYALCAGLKAQSAQKITKHAVLEK